MTALRIAGWVLAYFAVTVTLLAMGWPGILAWLGCMTLGLALPNHVVDAITTVRWHHVITAWQWLDRR